MNLLDLVQDSEVASGPLHHKNGGVCAYKEHICVLLSLDIADPHCVDDIVGQGQIRDVVDILVEGHSEYLGHALGEVVLGASAREDDVVVRTCLHAQNRPVLKLVLGWKYFLRERRIGVCG